MKKLLSVLIILAFAFAMNTTFAQGKNYLGIGANLALPMGSFSDAAGTGFGATGSFEMTFTPNITGIATAGYLKFGGQDFGYFSYDYSDIPIMVGIKYYFTPGMPFYAIGQVGLNFFNANASYTGPFGSLFEASGSSTEFGLGLGVGYEVPVGTNAAIDLTGMFNIISDLNYIGVRAAYRFGI
jgi:hypothetical protein